MKIKTEIIKIKKLNGDSIDVAVLNRQLMNETHPSTFFMHSEFIRENIPIGMWIKCGAHWPNGIHENVWVEVVDINKDEFGGVSYTARFDDLNLGGLGAESIAYSIKPKHILDCDFDRYKELLKN